MSFCPKHFGKSAGFSNLFLLAVSNVALKVQLIPRSLPGTESCINGFGNFDFFHQNLNFRNVIKNSPSEFFSLFVSVNSFYS